MSSCCFTVLHVLLAAEPPNLWLRACFAVSGASLGVRRFPQVALGSKVGKDDAGFWCTATGAVYVYLLVSMAMSV